MKIQPHSPAVPRRPRSRRGFTLMELLLVLAIIGMLIGGGSVAYKGIMESARETKTMAQLGTLNGLMQMYQSRQNGKLPSQSAGLNALVTSNIADNPDVLLDAWGNQFVYVFPAKRSTDKYDLYSKGRDQLENTLDDIGNWTSGG